MTMKLHEAIALRKGEVGRNKSRLTELYKGFQKPAIFNGFAKKYEPIDDDGEKLAPENKRVQRRVEKDLEQVQKSLKTLWNTVASVERGNCEARGDVVVMGETIMADVPVTTLLFLENQLNDLRTMLESIPTLSSDFEWNKDENDGLYKTPVTKTHRNKKMEKVLTLVQQDEHHPGQAKTITVDVLAGYWHAVQHSGAMPTQQKEALLERMEHLIDGVKAARARANGNDAPDVDMSPVLNYIFSQ